MTLKFLPRRKHRIGIGILAAVVVIILFLALLINSYWSPILAKKVRDVVLSSSDSLYHADFSKAELHVLRGTIVFYNITLKPDTAVYNRRIRQHLAPNNLVELQVKKLTLDHIHPFKLYFGHKLDIGNITLNEPELNVSYSLNHTKDTTQKDNRTPWQKISKTLHSIHIGQIFLNDVKLMYKDYSGHKAAISKLREMNLSAYDLLIDSVTQTDKSRLLFCRDIVAELNNYSGISPSGLYRYSVKHLKLSTFSSQLSINGLSLSPVNKAAFFDKTKKDRFNVQLDSIRVNHFDFLSYHKYRTFKAANMIVNGGNFTLFSNPNKKSTTKTDQAIFFPAPALSRVGTDLTIDTVTLKHIKVVYSEYNPKAFQTGSITFNETRGTFFNITNNKAALAKNNFCKIQLNTLFMNSGRFAIQMNFNLSDSNHTFTYNGDLGSMDLQQVNPAAMPFAMVKVKEGKLKRLTFDIKGSDKVNKGNVTVLYNDLKVKLLSPDTAMDGFKGKTIESLYANIFILKHNNPDKEGGTPRSFNVNYMRQRDSPFFKTIWQTLLSGIKPAVGLDEKTQDATKAKMSEHQKNKQERIQKRAARKLRRAERRQEKAAKK